MKPILVVGSINVDYFIRMPRMPKAGESMVVERIRKRLWRQRSQPSAWQLPSSDARWST